MLNKQTKIIKVNIHQGILTNSTELKTSIITKISIFKALSQKQFLISEYNVAKTNDTICLQIAGFLQTSKLGRYRKNIKQKNNVNIDLLNNNSKKKNLLTNLFLNKEISTFKNIIVETTILNKFVSDEKINLYYMYFIKYRQILFSRGRNRFLDFLKVSALFAEKKISLKALLEILGAIFKNVNKKQHNKFIAFIKYFFEIMIKEEDLKGLKLKISGRLLGKARSNSAVIEMGILPLNSANSDMVSEISHVYTTQGAFGIQMSVNYKKK